MKTLAIFSEMPEWARIASICVRRLIIYMPGINLNILRIDIDMHARTHTCVNCLNNVSLTMFSLFRLLQQRFKQTIISARYGGITEATKRLLAQLPICAQSYSSSPYLDLSLFCYDDKWVSMMERPKACGEHPIRYINDSILFSR